MRASEAQLLDLVIALKETLVERAQPVLIAAEAALQ
jgi:hypothetical protein